MHLLVTGAAGFIGFHCCKRLLSEGKKVIGIDNLNDYYDVNLKNQRLAILQKYEKFTFIKADIADQKIQETLNKYTNNIEYIIHLAAQAGVRYSLENPYVYADTNVMGHLVLLEFSKTLPNFKNFIFASTSSVYGSNTKMPFSVDDRTDTPIAIYAATKKCGELMAHSYSHLFKIPTTVLRFFTVYGPWGRPDMAAFIFVKAMRAGEKIKVFNNGKMRRNFTYVEDIVAGIVGAVANPPNGDLPYKIYNIGNNESESLMDFIHIIEEKLGVNADMDMQPIQPGDVKETIADISESTRDLGFIPQTSLKEGLGKFIDWYKGNYHG